MNAFVGSLLERVLEQTSPNEPRSVTFPLPDDKEIERVLCLCLGRMGNYKLQSKQSGLYGRALQFRGFFCQVGDLEVIDAVINKIEFIQFCVAMWMPRPVILSTGLCCTICFATIPFQMFGSCRTGGLQNESLSSKIRSIRPPRCGYSYFLCSPT